MDGLQIQKASVVGHDWGAALAWVLAAVIPDRVEKLVAISVGHPPPSATACRSSSSREAGTCGSSSSGKWPRSSSPGTICGSSKSGQGTLPDGELYLEDLSRPGRLTVAFKLVPSQHRPPETGVPADPTPADQSLDTGSLRERRVKGYIVMEEEASAGRRPDGLRRDRLAVAEYGCFSAIARDRDTTSWEARCQSHLK